MDIEVYDDIYASLEKYIDENQNAFRKAAITHYPPTSPKCPLVIFDEVRNQPKLHTFGEIPDRVANLGYRVRIYAKQIGSNSKQKIARQIAQQVDSFLIENVGLRQVSMNPEPTLDDGEIYGIVLMYTASFYENRRNFIL